ncbi:MAG: hypothetical protein AB1744_07590, partial [Candidatus Zixiibacteriota bacterium]
MTFTGRIRIFLIVVAVLPPLLVMAAVYAYSARQTAVSERRQARLNINKFEVFHQLFLDEAERDIKDLRGSEEFGSALFQ